MHRLARARVFGRVLHRPLLDAGDARRNADDHARLAPPAGVHLLDEVAQHLLAHFEVGDDTVLQRSDGLDPARRATHHALGLETDGDGAPVGDVDGDDRRLVQHHTLPSGVDECVGGAQVDGEVAAERERIASRHHHPPVAVDEPARAV